MEVGIVTIDTKLTTMISSYPVEPSYSLSEISEKGNLNKYDGLIIPISKEDKLTTAIDWVLASQKFPNMFVWIYSEGDVETEEDILRKLGVNEVIEGEEHIPRLFLSIENLMNKLSFILTKDTSGKQKMDDNFYDVRNRSIRLENERSISLTRTESSLLKAFIKEFDNVITYDELMEIGWPDNSSPGNFRLANSIFHLRNKIEQDKRYKIINVRSKGYMLSSMFD